MRESRKNAIECYIKRINEQVLTMEGQSNINPAMQSFDGAFDTYLSQSTEFSVASARHSVAQYYQDEFAQ